MNTVTLYHTAKISDNGGGWSVESSLPASSDCEPDFPDCGTGHPSMRAVQCPMGWRMIGVIDDGERVAGVFAIDFDNQH